MDIMLEMNRNHSLIFKIASKYCILDSFVDYDGYSISSKGFLPTVQFSSVAQSCSTLCDPMNCSTPGLPVHHQLPEFRRNGVAIMVNRRVQNAVLGCNLKNDRTISVRFQGKPFNITEIQVYAPTSNAEEAEVERFCEDLQDLVELTPQKDVLFIIGD